MSKAEDFISELSSPSERWLARVMVQTLQEGFRTAEDFVEFFSPAEIMESLDSDPWAGFLKERQSITAAMRKAVGMKS